MLKKTIVTLFISFLWSKASFAMEPKPVSAYNEEHLKSLHHQLNKGASLVCKKFDLRGADLRGLNLRNADFSGAELRGAIFANCQLQKANFSGANLWGASFESANVRRANFKWADLTSVDLTSALVDGAIFKGARLLDLKYEKALSAKGTLLADKGGLCAKLEKEKEVDTLKKAFLSQSNPDVITFQKGDTLQNIHSYLYNTFNVMQCGNVIVDLRGCDVAAQDCLDFLKAPLFRPFVREVKPICDQMALLVYLNGQQKTQRKKSHESSQNSIKTLDLHGKIPLEVKYTLIDKFIKGSYERSRGVIEIITGRGIHNPDGVMGKLWLLCRRYLSNRKFESYIKEIESLSKNGGWRLFLKHNKSNKKSSEKERVLKGDDNVVEVVFVRKRRSHPPVAKKKILPSKVIPPVVQMSQNTNEHKSYAQVVGAKKDSSAISTAEKGSSTPAVASEEKQQKKKKKKRGRELILTKKSSVPKNKDK